MTQSQPFTAMIMGKSYSIDKSPFYKLVSPYKLAEYLGLNWSDLNGLLEEGDDNYKQFMMEERWIETPNDRLKSVQKVIHNLLARIAPPDFLFSAYKGRSAIQNANYHLDNATEPMIKLDVRRFYPSCQGRKVGRFFSNDLLCGPQVASILTSLSTIGPTSNSSWRHLPTGGVTSPILAFLAYKEMFHRMNAICEEKGLTFSVMADDITISGNRAYDVLAMVKNALEVEGLHSNWSKQRIWSSRHSKKIVTGVDVTPKGLRVPRKIKEKIKTIREQMLPEKSPKARVKLYRKWLGYLSFAGQIEPRFKIGAREALLEWKKDAEAWASHLEDSVSRSKHHRARGVRRAVE